MSPINPIVFDIEVMPRDYSLCSNANVISLWLRNLKIESAVGFGLKATPYTAGLPFLAPFIPKKYMHA